MNSLISNHCDCPRGSAGSRCELPCRKTANVVFAVDSSGSVELKNFYRMLNTIKELVIHLNLSGTQIGRFIKYKVMLLSVYIIYIIQYK